jgi:hypothetical protein
VLVRRVKQGSTWHPATDDLRGTAEYGTYGSATSDATFSVKFSSWLNLTSAMLFITGELPFVNLVFLAFDSAWVGTHSRRQEQVADDDMGRDQQQRRQLRFHIPKRYTFESLR